MISAKWNMIFKNLVLTAIGTIRIWFLPKKTGKNIHACAPLNGGGGEGLTLLIQYVTVLTLEIYTKTQHKETT